MALERPEPSVLTKRKAQDVIMLTELRECVNTSGVQGEKKGDEDENEKLKQLLEIDEDY